MLNYIICLLNSHLITKTRILLGLETDRKQVASLLNSSVFISNLLQSTTVEIDFVTNRYMICIVEKKMNISIVE